MKLACRLLALAPAALLPLYVVRFSVRGLPTTLLELAVLVALVAYGVLIRAEGRTRMLRREIVRSPYALATLLFLVAGIISVIDAPDHRAALGLFRAYLLEPIAYAVVVADLMRETRWRLAGLAALGLSGLTVALANIAAVSAALVGGTFNVNDPTVVIYTTSNAVGLLLGPLAAVALAVTLGRDPRWIRLVAAGLALIMLLAIALSYSRAAWIAAVVSMVVVAGFDRRRVWLLTPVVALVAAASLLPHVMERMRRQFEVNGGHSSIPQRLALWRSTWGLLSHRPLTGAGLSGFKARLVPYQTSDYRECLVGGHCLTYPHNLFLNAWTETGLLGLIAFAWLLGTWVWVGLRAIVRGAGTRSLQVGILAAFAYLLVHGLVDVPYWKNDLALEFWILVGLQLADLGGPAGRAA